MKDKIIARLKAKFSGVNLSNARLDAIADKLAPKITDEATIDAKLDELNEVVPFSELAKLDDWQRSKEQKEKEKQNPKPADPAPKVDPPKTEEGETPTDKLLKQLLQKVEQLETSKTAESNTARLLGILKEKNVPEAYYQVAVSGRTFKDAAEVDAFATTLTEAYGKYHQEQVNNGLKGQPAPVMGVVTDPAKDVSPLMQSYIKDKQTEIKKTA